MTNYNIHNCYILKYMILQGTGSPVVPTATNPGEETKESYSSLPPPIITPPQPRPDMKGKKLHGLPLKHIYLKNENLKDIPVHVHVCIGYVKYC